MSNLTKVSKFFRSILKPSIRPLAYCNYSDKINEKKISDSAYIQDEDEKKLNVADYLDDGDNLEEREQEIELLRNKSGLLPQHRRVLQQEKPYDEAESWVHNTVQYQRKLYGRFGAISGVDPRIMFPSADDLADRAEYERVAYPHTITEMINIVKIEKDEKLSAIRKREADIAKKLGKLNQWTKELNARVAKKEADARDAKEKRERLIDDVRRQFGFRLSPNDPRFIELIAQREEEAKKAKKLARKQMKQDILLKKLQDQANEAAGTKPNVSKESEISENKNKTKHDE